MPVSSIKTLFIAAGLSMVGAVSAFAGDRTDKTPTQVEYRYVGQGRILLPIYDSQRPEPYALTGQQDAQRVEDWSTRGHYLELGQTKVFIPASRQSER